MTINEFTDEPLSISNYKLYRDTWFLRSALLSRSMLPSVTLLSSIRSNLLFSTTLKIALLCFWDTDISHPIFI